MSICKSKRAIIIILLLFVIFGAVCIVYYNIMMERNSSYYYTANIYEYYDVDDLDKFKGVPSSLFDFISTSNNEIQIPISKELDNYNLEGYLDLDLYEIDILLDGDTEIEYVEPSEKVESIEVLCQGDGTHELLNFTKYYPNLIDISFFDCNFPDDYVLDGENLTTVIFEGNTNVDYKLINDYTNLSRIVIIDKELEIDKLPLNDNIGTLWLTLYTPIVYDFEDLPSNLHSFKLNTRYDGNENEDTIYGLEKYDDLQHFSYYNAKYITQESYDYVIKNEINGIPEDIEVIE